MRICIIANQIYKSGGIERVLSHRINAWIKDGIEVHLITNENKQRDPYFYYDSKMIHHDLDGGFDKSISLFSPSNLFLASQYFFKLRKSLNIIDPEVIVMVNYSYDYYFIPVLSKNIYRIKEYHSSFVVKKGIVSKIKEYYSKFYDTHVFLSVEEATLSSKKNIVVIPNPIISSNIKSNILAERGKVIIAAGRIVSIKGFERLIESWARIAIFYPDWRLEIYGDGDADYISSLNYLINKKNISSNTFIYSSTSQITSKMLESRIYAMTSLTECFPMVLLEAMQARMAIIAFDCPTGPRNIIQHQKTGFLIKDNDINQFSLQLEQLINDDNLAQEVANNAYLDVQQYDIDIIMKRWNALIKEGPKKY